jgi:hypothetical protein
VHREQNYENERLAKRLCNVSCRVITNDISEKEFSNHVSYKKIATKYDDFGDPKELVQLNSSLEASQVKRLNSPSQFCTVKSSGKSFAAKRKNPLSKAIRLY